MDLKQGLGVWNGFNWLWTGTNGWFSTTRTWTSGFHIEDEELLELLESQCQVIATPMQICKISGLRHCLVDDFTLLGMLHKGLYFKLWLNNKHKNCHMPYLFLEVWPQTSRIGTRVTVRIFKIYFNVNFTSTSRSYKMSLSLRFPHQNPLCISLLPQKSHMPNQPPIFFFFLTFC